MPEWLVALLGVVVGFLLNEIASLIRKKVTSAAYKKALLDELRSNLHQLTDKKDIMEYVLLVLAKNGMVGAESVPFSDVAYVNYFPELITEFTSLERDNIRHIYGTLKTLDSITTALESGFKSDLVSGAFKDVVDAYSGKVDDVVRMYDTVALLIEGVLENKPIDIYGKNN